MCRAAFFVSQKMLLSSARHMNSLTAVAHAARHRYARSGVLRTREIHFLTFCFILNTAF